MFSDPNSSAMICVVEMIRVEHLLDLSETQFSRELCGHFVAGSFDHETQLMSSLGIQIGGGFRVQLKVGQKYTEFRDAGGVFFAVGMDHRQTQMLQVENADGGLRGSHSVLRSQFQIKGFQL